jgi:hypothetical protein
MTATILPFLRGRERIEILRGRASGAEVWLLELVEGDGARNIVGDYPTLAAAREAAAAWRRDGVRVVEVCR